MKNTILQVEGMAATDNNIERFVNMVKTGTYKIPEIQKHAILDIVGTIACGTFVIMF